MAAGSMAKMKAQRDATGYRTGIGQGRRCDGCSECRPSRAPHTTRYDRACLRHHVGVKTHGVCEKWTAK